MNRLQKKCFFAAAGAHLLLALILLIGPAFLSRNAPDDKTVLTIIDLSKISDNPTRGGGSAPVAPPAQGAPQPAPRAVEQQPVAPPPQERTEAPEPKKNPTPRDTTTPTKPTPSISTKLVNRSTGAKPTTDNNAQDRADARRRSAALNRSIQNLRTGLSSTTSIDPQIGAGTGEANIRYADAVQALYEARWIQLDNVPADDTSAKVSITIASDGTVLSGQIIKSSGNTQVDAVIQKTLDAIKTVPAFPSGTTDKQRTYTINFNHQAKQPQ